MNDITWKPTTAFALNSACLMFEYAAIDLESADIELKHLDLGEMEPRHKCHETSSSIASEPQAWLRTDLTRIRDVDLSIHFLTCC